MFNKFRIYVFGLLMLLSLTATAQQLSENARISLLTCSPGQELYARYGHTAIRICDPQNNIDAVFNYGIFDFNTEHFYWKFMRGETWYELGATSYRWFMREYDDTQRDVYEQVLNLTPTQCEAIWQALLINYEPENRRYLYNFVFNNCATRPYWLIANTLGDSIRSSYTGCEGLTYRQFIRYYTGTHTWANAGINLLFGRKADRQMMGEQRLFMPEELMFFLNDARLSDGTPLVSKSHIAPFVIDATPWYLSWEFGMVLYFILIAVISLIDRRRKRRAKFIDWLFCIVYAMLLLLVAFLVFFSCHPLVGFGWRLLILPLVHLCARFVYILR